MPVCNKTTVLGFTIQASLVDLRLCLSQIIKGSGNKLLHLCIYSQSSFISLCINWSTFNVEAWQGGVPCHLSCLPYSWTAGTAGEAAAKDGIGFTKKVTSWPPVFLAVAESWVNSHQIHSYDLLSDHVCAIQPFLNGQLLLRVQCGWREWETLTVLQSVSLRHAVLMVVTQSGWRLATAFLRSCHSFIKKGGERSCSKKKTSLIFLQASTADCGGVEELSWGSEINVLILVHQLVCVLKKCSTDKQLCGRFWWSVAHQP